MSPLFKLRRLLGAAAFLAAASLAVTGLHATPKRILMLGDSITQGGVGLASYRDPLIRLLNGANINSANPSGTVYSFEMVGSMSTTLNSNPANASYPSSLALHPQHEGHYGWRADQILNGFGGSPPSGTGSGSLASWLSGYSVDLALIHIGTNDAIQNRGDGVTPSPTFVQDTRTDIEGIIDAIKAVHPAAVIFLAKPAPMGPDGNPNTNTDDERAADLQLIVNEIANIASAKGATVVDHNFGFNLAWLQEEGFLDVHPGPTGEAYIATQWFNAIKAQLNQLGSPVITSNSSASGTFGSAFSFQVTASNSPTSFGASGLPPGLSINTSSGLITGTPTAAGIYGATVSATNASGTGQAGLTITVAKAAATVSLSSLSQAYNGTPRSVGVSTTPSGLTVNVTYDGSSTAPTNAGNYAVVATINDANYQGSTSGTLIVSQLSQTITFAAIADRTLAQSPLTLAASASSGLTVVFELVSGPATLSGTTLTPTGEGVVAVRATQPGNTNYTAASPVTRSFTVTKANATVTLSNLAQTYTGSPRSVGVSTSPSGLSVNVTYSGSSTAPSNAGNYAVVATINDSVYQGSASDTLVVATATQTITFAAIADRTYVDSPVALSASASSGLAVTFSIVSGPATVSGTALTITGVGSITVRATQAGNANVAAATPVERSFTVSKATATVNLTGLAQTYDGAAKPASATTTPSGLTVALTYDGSSTAPTNAGSYAVVATITDANYQGSANGTLVVSLAAQIITFPVIADRVYTTTPVALSATASSELGVTFAVVSGPATVSGSSMSLTGVGTITIRATQSGNANYAAATPVDRSFAVSKATATVNLTGLSQTYDGTAKPASATTTPSGLTVALTYDGSSTAPTDAGSYAVVATVTDANYQGSANGTLVVSPAAQTITFPVIADRAYTTTPVALSATASSGLAVTFAVVSGPATVSGSSMSLTGVGTITIRATQSGNANHAAATPVERTFIVSKATASVALDGLSQTYSGSPRVVTTTTTPSGLVVVLTYDGSANAPTNAGSYAVAAAITDANYQGTASGTLVVARTPLVARADDKQRIEGAPDPAFTISYTGFVAGETVTVLDVAPTASTSATGSSTPGTYPITLSGGSDNNYALTLQPGTLTITAFSASPVITSQPASVAVTTGASASFTVAASGAPTPSYQWQRSTDGGATFVNITDGGGVSGTATPTLQISATVLGQDGHRFRGVASNSFGSAISATATLTVTQPEIQMVNLATRAISLGGDRVIIPGFVISGTGTKRVLVRAVGPKLHDFGITAFLPDPILSVFRQGESTPIATNDNWITQEPGRPDPGVVGDQVGAFALTAGSPDQVNDTLSAAVVLDLPAGPYSAIASDRLDRTGIGIVEIYDVDPPHTGNARLVNVSNRGFVGVGSEVMIPGFVVTGTVPRRYLIRAIGPKLGDFGLSASTLLADPRLVVMRGNTQIAINDDWGVQASGGATAAEVETFTQQVGAFGLRSSPGLTTDDQKSASVAVWLEPGSYTVLVSGATGETGVAIAEVYEIR